MTEKRGSGSGPGVGRPALDEGVTPAPSPAAEKGDTDVAEPLRCKVQAASNSQNKKLLSDIIVAFRCETEGP